MMSSVGTRLVLAAMACVLMNSCASAPKDGESETPVAESVEPGKMPETVQGPAPKDMLMDGARNQKGALDPKYQPLAQAVRAGKAEQITQESSKILTVNPYDATALNTLALFYFRKGRLGAARLLLAKAFEKNPSNASILNNLAIVSLAEGDQAGAIANFKKALRVDDSHPEALGNLGSIYAGGGDFLKATPFLEQSYKANKANSSVANNYAVALRVNKNFDRAKRVYEDLLAQNSRDVNALLNYAILLVNFMNRPKDGLAIVYKVKFLETDRKEVVRKANELEKKAKSEVK